MPIYEYECKHCHHNFEALQKISDPVIKKCPNCQKDTAARLVSAAGFQLKGGGWYVTDFKDKPKAKSEDKSKSTEATSSSDSSSSEKASKD